MTIPPGHTEATVLEAIERAVSILASSFQFGYFDTDDIKQEGRVFALEALAGGKYDSSRPLANFLYTHIRNRLINLRRNKLRRSDAPCAPCHNGDFCTGSHSPCARYQAWQKRNTAKANLMRPMELENVAEEGKRNPDGDAEGDVELNELMKLIDLHLPVDLRAAFLQMKAGVNVPHQRREQVEAAVREILGVEVCQSEEE